jgi:antitoxin (DNA-binding transcriptional repressor) of toxin-antitoxin stability system
MRDYAPPIDVKTSIDLQRLAARVKATGQPVPLTENDEIVAVVQPAPKHRAKRLPSKADLEAFQASAGSWEEHVDLDQFLSANEESRRISTRPPVEL